MKDIDKEKKKSSKTGAVEKAELMKKYPKPWTKEIHDKFIKESGKTKEEHDAWHKENMPDAEW